MALDLIVGPPNSNRAGAVLDRLRGALDRDPVLVVPTGDDIVRFERELCAEGVPQVGATIRTFASAVRRDRRPHRHPGAAAPLAATAPGAGARRRRLDGSSRAPPIVRLAGLLASSGHPDRRAPGRARIPRGPPGRRRRGGRRRRAGGGACSPLRRVRAPARRRRPLRRRVGRSGRGRSASRPAGCLGRRAGAHLRLRRPDGGPARPDLGSRRRLRSHVRRELLGSERARGARRPADALDGRGRLRGRGARVRHGLHGPRFARPHRPERLRERLRDGQSARRRARVPRQRRRARRGRSRRSRDRTPAGGRDERGRHRRHAPPSLRGWPPVRVGDARDGHSRDARSPSPACLHGGRPVASRSLPRRRGRRRADRRDRASPRRRGVPALSRRLDGARRRARQARERRRSSSRAGERRRPRHLRASVRSARPGRARPRGRRRARGASPRPSTASRRRSRASARPASRSTRSSSGPASRRQSSWRSSPRSRRFRASTLPTSPTPPTRSSRRPSARGRARPRAGSASSARTGSARDA